MIGRSVRADIVGTLSTRTTREEEGLPPLLILLTVVTGLVDALAYLKLGHVLVGNMTGNVVFLGFTAGGASNLSVPGSLLALGIQNATARRLAVADLNTTVLTLTLTGIAADSRLGGGSGAKTVRRLLAVTAMFVGAVVGALLLLEVDPVAPLAVALGLLAIVATAAERGARRPAPARR